MPFFYIARKFVKGSQEPSGPIPSRNVPHNMNYISFRSVSVYLILPAALGPGVYSTSKRNEYQNQKNNISGEHSAAGA
jgi:hypothetical protein